MPFEKDTSSMHAMTQQSAAAKQTHRAVDRVSAYIVPLTPALSLQGRGSRTFPPSRGEGADTSLPVRGRVREGGPVPADGKRSHSFIRCRRAAATAIGAAVMSLMSIGGFALTSDHIHLVYQRDTLKAATDAASIAATRHWQQALGHLTDDDQIKAALRPMAERYILANIPESRRGDAAATLNIELVLHHGAGMVDVGATADLSGGVIFSRWIIDEDAIDIEKLKITQVETRTERIEEAGGGGITEVILAIDVTSSMGDDLDGCRSCGEESRMAIVKRAAQELVDSLSANPDNTVAVGLVPWHYRVQFDQSTRTKWEDNGWALYRTRRYYPSPYLGSWLTIGPLSGDWYPNPHLVTAAGEWHDLPTNKPEAWQGCVDQRRMSGQDPPGISAVPPTVEPFSMGFYSPSPPYIWGDPISLQCAQTDPAPDRWRSRKDLCFVGTGHAATEQQTSQFNCGLPTIVPLTTDLAKIKRRIDALRASGHSTYSTLGVVWGHRLLAQTWRNIWGDATHPLDQAEGIQKALVLLTDGADNHLKSWKPYELTVPDHRDQACTAAKNAGIKVFTIAAMERSRVGELADDLERCSSQADDPEGKYVFVNSATPADLLGAFQQIGEQLSRFRRVY